MFQSLEAKHPKFYQVFRFFVVIAASIFYAWNLRCFAKTAGLFPGGFSGLSLLLQEIGLAFFGISIPYTLLKYSLQGTTHGRYLTGGVPPVRFSM
jgi:uncharacterized membrane-anchored protein YitT (DUF2179 family)